MITTQKLKELLPSWYDGLLETKVLMDVEQDLVDALALQIQKVQDNQFIATADSETLTIYEAILHITRQATDTLEMRRLRILSRLSSQKPYTKRYLEEALTSFGGSVTITNIYNEYRLLIKSSFENQGQMSDADYLIRTVIPANLIADVQNHLNLEPLTGRVFMAEGMSTQESLIITQDFNDQTQINKKMALGVGVSQAALNTVTGDFNEVSTITGQVVASAVSTQLQDVCVTSGGFVSAEFITVKKERD